MNTAGYDSRNKKSSNHPDSNGTLHAKALLILLSTLFIMTMGSSCFAADSEIYGTTSDSPTSKTPTYSIRVTNVEGLAGLKMILLYDKEMLVYKSMEKSKAASGMMSVVNDKTPGRLIVVMAAAQGFSGDDVELMKLGFEKNTPSEKTDSTASDSAQPPLNITSIEMMSDKLKTIECSIGKFR